MRQVRKVQASSVKIGSKVMLVMGVYTLVVSLLWIFLTEVAFVSDVAVYTGQTWPDFLASNPKHAELYIITKKLLGIELLLASVLIILIAQKSYSRGEKWSWYALSIAGILTWGSLIGYRIAIGYVESIGIMTFLIGIILFVIGIALPAKTILGKKAT
jgi:hypothetical protein